MIPQLALVSKNDSVDGLTSHALLCTSVYRVCNFWFWWVSIPFILFFSSFVALAFAIPDLLRKSKTMSSKVPYGPYLVLGCVLYIFLLEQIIKFINL